MRENMTDTTAPQLSAAAPRKIDAVATRDGRWWLVTLPELGTAGQARSVREISAVAVEVAALWLDVPEEAVDVTVRVHVDDEAEALWEQARQLEAEVRRREQEAAALRRRAVRLARDAGYTLDAVGAAFHVTQQRVQQLAKSDAA